MIKTIVTLILLITIQVVYSQKDNLPTPVLDSVSVDTINGQCHTKLGWEKYTNWNGFYNPHPDSTWFVIYSVKENAGYIAYDTIWDTNKTEYFDTLSNPFSNKYRYGLAVFSRKNGVVHLSTIEDQFSQNIVLTIEKYDSCKQELSLRWNKYYVSAQTDPEYHIIGVSEDDNITQQTTDTTITISNCKPDQNYVFVVHIIGSNFTSTSNPVQQKTALIIDPQWLNIVHVETSATLYNTISVKIDNTANTKGVDLYRSSEYSTDYLLSKTKSTSSHSFDIEDNVHDNQSYFYYAQAKNTCNEPSTISDTLNTIILKGTMQSDNILLEANKLQKDATYQLYRVTSNQTDTYSLTPPLTYSDNQIFYQTLDVPEVTYRVVGETANATIISNPITFILTKTLKVPNAIIVGNHINGTFKPYVKGTKPETYHVEIYSKWGELVFQSESIENGWNGYYNGQPVIIGAYLYLIKYKFKSQKTQILKGTINVIH